MATNVKLYYYNGYESVCDKRDNMHLIADANMNVITDRKTKLECILESSTYYTDFDDELNRIAANYVYFVDWGNRASWWFVTDVSRDGSTFYYHLKLDVLMTNWNSIKNNPLILERSSTESPSNNYPILDDNLWRVGNKRNVIKVDSINSSISPITSTSDKYFVLTTVGGMENAIAGKYGISGTLANSYILSQDESLLTSKAFYSTDFFTALSVYFTQPTSAIISNRVYPFSLNSLPTFDTKKIYFGSEYITSEDGEYVFSGALTEWLTLNFGKIDFNNQLIGDFRDYSPYSNYYIHLPYTGFKEIDIRYFDSGVISIKCRLNIVTGQARYELYNNSDSDPILQFPTELGISVPYSTSGIGAAYQSLLNLGVSAVSSLASPGYTYKDSGYENLSDIRKKRVKGRLVTSSKRVKSDVIDRTRISYKDPDFTNLYLSHISASTNVMNISFTGDPSSYSDDDNEAFLIIVSPTTDSSFDSIQEFYSGKLVMKELQPSDLTSGYQKFCNVYLPMDGRCTEEHNELVDILENGVWIKQPIWQ